MKYLYFAIIMCLLGMPVAAADRSVEEWLSQLDASLAKRDVYEQQRTDRIDQLKSALARMSSHAVSAAEGDRFEVMYQLYDEYKSYCYDSARHYAYESLRLAQTQQRPDRVARSQIAVAFCLISAGILSEAHDVLATIDRSQLTGNLLFDYYDQSSHLWRSMADYVHEDPFYTKYINLCNAYKDSILQLVPEGSLPWWSATGQRQMRDHQFEQALVSLGKALQLGAADKHLVAMTTAEMAWAYIWLDDEERAIEYFAQSAICDNETATREITALYHLARLVYKRGDYERASHYVHQALEDVNFYNTRLRKVEINDILPIIEQDRYNAMRSQRNGLIAASVLFVVLLSVILYSYLVIRRKNRKLTEARETIAGQLEQLKHANHQLMEDDKIKNAYIGRSFYTNAEYIAKLEKLYLTIDRKIMARQYDDLRSMMKQSTLNAERENMYEAFDQTFLKLFPNFVERYNQLFEEKDRKLPANDHALTSEMRIFALIRLGISDSERIAKFLDYSVHTVNTYKTRIKNRSTAENEQFERLIMEI